MDVSKATDETYFQSARELYETMAANGFDGAYPVPIDPKGELLGGAHRVACALALGIGEIVVKHESRPVWAPSWGYRWFVENGMAGEDLERLRQDWAKINSGGSAVMR